ncbi:arabinan endo-1,5-alpha-L-arabinosidase [Marinilabilia salmonicolor]|uniref:Arabinan endo-1,5-alpha-L-arabinosidase n=1 Tax=Marinilabilia salmonicolor TaxID=989 RepID=A0A368VCV4_9BACT|nr:arabinan endo-1,5-alpha-L-arabinosidase [Marinilabilia salmonicolor]RCW38946.1 arabinan endo-1,5-alpha-L-arabinosidase [Marinilabilia salmonicolor]
MIFSKLLFSASMAMLLMASRCTHDTTSSPEANPYKDDYSDITPLSFKDQWGTANVHDPSIIKTDSFYYVYSTDAYYIKRGVQFNDTDEKMGNIPIRRSKDLVNWEFTGWALDSIPQPAIDHVHSYTGNKGADNMWAPYIYKHNDTYRIYYSVSSFGSQASYIGLAEGASPEGPFTDKGVVVKTDTTSVMNAIDASVIKDKKSGKVWMHYGSYFGGLHVMELDEETGLAKNPGDNGKLVATRANKETRVIEAPEIIYHPDFDQYYLFVSYDPLFTFYNVRVGRSDNPDGPFLDYFGNDMAEETNNFPMLTHSYMFENHPGWSGNGHCGVLNDDGKFFMLHQGRLAPDNLQMRMHIREMKWLPSGWPVVSPERYAGLKDKTINAGEIPGTWEIIHFKDLVDQTELWQGQIPPGGWTYDKSAFNVSEKLELSDDGKINHESINQWTFDGEHLEINDAKCIVFTGWDWENEKETILFSGIMENGTAIWGKKVE